MVNLIYGTISVRRTGTNGQVFQDTKTTTTRHCIAIRQELQNERLGHSSIILTLDTYSHLVPDIQKEAVNALDSLGI